MAVTRIVSADVQVTGVLDMRQNPVQNLSTNLDVYPSQPHHGASKLYVDTLRDEIVADLPNEVDNGEF